jgi:ribosomal protein S6--L-glutamate ligase
MTQSRDLVTLIYRPDDFEPKYVEAAKAAFMPIYSQPAARAGFRYRAIPLNELVPASSEKPRLWFEGRDLLETRQCFQVDDFSWDPQTAHFLKAVCRTIEESDSVLLNRSVGVAEHLGTDKLAISQRARAWSPGASQCCGSLWSIRALGRAHR